MRNFTPSAAVYNKKKGCKKETTWRVIVKLMVLVMKSTCKKFQLTFGSLNHNWTQNHDFDAFVAQSWKTKKLHSHFGTPGKMLQDLRLVGI